MSEPEAIARGTNQVHGVVHWTVQDERIGWRSDAYAVRTPKGVVLVDPLPLRDDALTALGDPIAICLTIQSHQRSAWKLRRRFGVPVFAPARSVGLEERPDVRFRDGDRLPGGLVAIHAPGPAHAGFVLRLGRPGGRGTLFLGDLMVREPSGAFAFVPDEYMDAPDRARDSVRRILELSFDLVCPGHGAPVARGAHAAIERALATDERRRTAAGRHAA